MKAPQTILGPSAELQVSQRSSRPGGSRNPRRRRHATDHVVADTKLCDACGKCVEACRRGVLSVKGPSFHRHVHFDHPDQCRGCGKCVDICPNEALTAYRDALSAAE